MADIFGRALRDWYRGDMDAPLVDRDGEKTRDHPIEAFYFTDVDPDDPFQQWWDSHLHGPLLEMGAGPGTHALYWQAQFETVAIDISEHLVAVMRDRGVEDARHADMFALTETFDADRFRSATARGTQLGLVGSREGLEAFLGDLATVTTDDATAVLDAYDPTQPSTADLLGYRSDVAEGLASRVFHLEYQGDVSETLLFRLFSPDRLRAAAAATPWSVVDVEHPMDASPGYYVAAMAKD